VEKGAGGERGGLKRGRRPDKLGLITITKKEEQKKSGFRKLGEERKKIRKLNMKG